MNIYEKLSAIQTELKAPKSKYNSFGKYAYRSCEDILEAVKPLLKKHKAILTLTDDMIAVGDWHYVRATARFMDAETDPMTSVRSVEVTAGAHEPGDKKGMDSSQITGTASSYARKYALNGLFLIDDTKDADTDEYKEENTARYHETGEEPATKNQITTLAKALKAHGKTMADLDATATITKAEEVTVNIFKAAMEELGEV